MIRANVINLGTVLPHNIFSAGTPMLVKTHDFCAAVYLHRASKETRDVTALWFESNAWRDRACYVARKSTESCFELIKKHLFLNPSLQINSMPIICI